MMKPLFKWTGGKNKMFGHYAPYFYPKDDFETFVDAFCGAGAASIWIASRYPNVKFILNDFNNEMMSLYRQLSEDGDEFIRKAIVVQNKFQSYTEQIIHCFLIYAWPCHPDLWSASGDEQSSS